MRKFLAFVLTLCMMITVLPGFAESAEDASGLEKILETVMKDDGGTEGKAARLIALVSGLKEKFAANSEELSAVLSKVSSKLQEYIKPGEEGLDSLLSGLKEKLTDGSDIDLSGLADSIFGGEDGSGGDILGGLTGLLGGAGQEEQSDAETADQDPADLEETIEKLNQQAMSETGEGVANKKETENIEDFYGDWLCSKFTFLGETYDMSDSGSGIFIGENTFYATENGGKAEDYMHPETAEMSLENGVMRVLLGRIWNAYVLTEDGELVQPGDGMTTYYVRSGK